MTNFQLLATDLDGTLLQKDNTIPDSLMKKLNALSKNGTYIVLATGRMEVTAKRYSGCISNDVLIISYNGALVMHGDECIFKSEIPVPVIRKLISYCKENGYYLQMYNGDTIFVESVCSELQSDPDTKYAKIIELGDFEKSTILPSPKLLISHDPNKIDGIMDDLHRLFPYLNITQSLPHLVEIMMSGVDKASSLKRLCVALNVERENVVACGDNYNDIPMIKWAGCGVAVANAVESLKRSADYVTVSDRSKGVEETIDIFFK